MESTQWICSPALPCACNPANPDACGCDETPDIAKACSKCGAPMVLINTDSGEPVAQEPAA